jgi:hypothetical protein
MACKRDRAFTGFGSSVMRCLSAHGPGALAAARDTAPLRTVLPTLSRRPAPLKCRRSRESRQEDNSASARAFLPLYRHPRAHSRPATDCRNRDLQSPQRTREKAASLANHLACKNDSGSVRSSSKTAAVSGPPNAAAVSRLSRLMRSSGFESSSGVWP